MSWKKAYYGAENPSLRRQWLVHFAVFFVLSSPYAFIVDFSPESWVFYTGMGISSLVAFIFMFYIWSIRARFSVLAHYGFIKRVIAIGSLPIMVFVFTVVFTIYTIPGLTTGFVGLDIALSSDFDKDEGVSRRSCQYRISSKILKYRFPPYLCVNKSQYERKTSEYTVLAKKSFLGVLYESVE